MRSEQELAEREFDKQERAERKLEALKMDLSYAARWGNYQHVEKLVPQILSDLSQENRTCIFNKLEQLRPDWRQNTNNDSDLQIIQSVHQAFFPLSYAMERLSVATSHSRSVEAPCTDAPRVLTPKK